MPPACFLEDSSWASADVAFRTGLRRNSRNYRIEREVEVGSAQEVKEAVSKEDQEVIVFSGCSDRANPVETWDHCTYLPS